METTKSLKKELIEKEIKLIKCCQKGDTSSFNDLIAIHFFRMKNSIKSFGINDDLCDEILQKTLIKIWKNIKNFKFKSSFYTWYYRISFNLFIDEKRKGSKRIIISLDDDTLSSHKEDRRWGGVKDFLDIKNIIESTAVDTYTSPTPFEVYEKIENEEERKKYVQKIMNLLSPKHRDVIWMYEYEGQSYEDIAKKLNCSIGTVMSRLFYARINAKRASKKYASSFESFKKYEN